MRQRFYFLGGLILSLSVTLSGQLKMGQWRTHLPYQYCEIVEATDDRIFCSSTGGMFTYNLEDHSIEKLSKIDGFSDVDVAEMRWNAEHQTLLIAYQNSNIDLVKNGEIVNLPDLMKKQIPGDKHIYDIYFHENIAYLSTGFGIVEVNISKNEIKETYYIGDEGNALKVNQVCVNDGTIYAATTRGIRMGQINDPFLVDYNSWGMVDDIPDPTGSFQGIAAFEGTLFAAWKDPSGTQDRLFYKPQGSWQDFPGFIAPLFREIKVCGDFMTLVDNWNVGIISKDYLVVRYLPVFKPLSATMDSRGNIWAASDGEGLTGSDNGKLWSVYPNGPRSTSTFDMASSGNILYMVQGGIVEGNKNQYRVAVMEDFSDNDWNYRTNEESRDLVALAIDPSDPEHVYAASWGYGLHEFRNGEEIAWYKVGNSSLQTIISGYDYVRIGGLAYDPLGNLWMNNTGVAEPISVLKSDGTWKSFQVNSLLSSFGILGDILVSSSGHLWGIIPSGNGLFALDFNGTIDDTSDDTYKRVSVTDEHDKVITNDVRSFIEDQDGNLWLGTSQGILVMYSPYRLFTEGSLHAQEILIPRNDGTPYGDPLLGEQVITAIAVDGANRKWIGTDGGGIYLVSEDGLETIHQFNALNSPLLSDKIMDIEIDQKTGEVFIATDMGIISYRGEALGGSDSYQNVVVYPNPVREDYQGPVAIKGLVAQTTVKIQDMGGNLVYEMESLGGQAIWDGRNFRGDRVATGVYLIFLSSPDGSLSHVTKLLFIH